MITKSQIIRHLEHEKCIRERDVNYIHAKFQEGIFFWLLNSNTYLFNKKL